MRKRKADDKSGEEKKEVQRDRGWSGRGEDENNEVSKIIRNETFGTNGYLSLCIPSYSSQLGARLFMSHWKEFLCIMEFRDFPLASLYFLISLLEGASLNSVTYNNLPASFFCAGTSLNGMYQRKLVFCTYLSNCCAII